MLLRLIRFLLFGVPRISLDDLLKATQSKIIGGILAQNSFPGAIIIEMIPLCNGAKKWRACYRTDWRKDIINGIRAFVSNTSPSNWSKGGVFSHMDRASGKLLYMLKVKEDRDLYQSETIRYNASSQSDIIPDAVSGQDVVPEMGAIVVIVSKAYPFSKTRRPWCEFHISVDCAPCNGRRDQACALAGAQQIKEAFGHRFRFEELRF